MISCLLSSLFLGDLPHVNGVHAGADPLTQPLHLHPLPFLSRVEVQGYGPAAHVPSLQEWQ